MRMLRLFAIAAVALCALLPIASQARLGSERDVAPRAAPQGERYALEEFYGTYEGRVQRRTLSGEERDTRVYRLTMRPDMRTGTVWIYRDGKVVYTLRVTGVLRAFTFTGETRLLEGSGYAPDKIELKFAHDGRSVHWHHDDGNLEGSGTLNRKR